MLDEKRKEVIQQREPCVTLDFAYRTRPDKAHKDHLDYLKNDDAMVGYLSELVKNNPQKQYALLTHDTGPRLTAESLGLKCIPIPDSWLLPTQQDSKTKEIEKLKNQIKHLQSQDPQIEIILCDASDDPITIKRLDYRRTIYTALEEEQIGPLIENLRQKFPEDKDFGSEETTPKPLSSKFQAGCRLEFIKTSSEKIEKYQLAYEKWLEDCREVLSSLHTTLNHQDYPRFVLTASNKGTRPATDTLIEFNINGNIAFFEVPDNNEENKTSICKQLMTSSPPVLPNVPKAPKGEWKKHKLLSSTADKFEGMIGRAVSHDFMRTMSPIHDSFLHRSAIPPKRDSNAFYWEGDRPDLPLKHTSLTCAQWRHCSKEQSFTFGLDVPKDEGAITGQFSCRIHAENIPSPVEVKLPIKITSILASCEDEAIKLVEEFTAGKVFPKDVSK